LTNGMLGVNPGFVCLARHLPAGSAEKDEGKHLWERLIHMDVRWKLRKALLVGIVLIATCFQGVILAADTAQRSRVLHARITRAQAERMALGRVPGGTPQRARLLRENDELIWSVDILTPLTRKVAAVQIDASSGQVLSKLAQNPADRAEESVAH
jgi:hypothetical protein